MYRAFNWVEVLLKLLSNTSTFFYPLFIGIPEDLTEVFEKIINLADSGSEIADSGSELADSGSELADSGSELAYFLSELANYFNEIKNYGGHFFKKKKTRNCRKSFISLQTE